MGEFTSLEGRMHSCLEFVNARYTVKKQMSGRLLRA